MRKYYIYISEPIKIKEENHFTYVKYTNFKCLGYVEGVKELYSYLGNYPVTSMDFNGIERKLFYPIKPCYIIVDDKDNIRDYYQLIKTVKKRTQKSSYKYRKDPVPNIKRIRLTKIYRKTSLISNEMRNQISKEEQKEIFSEYAGTKIHIPRPKRKQIGTEQYYGTKRNYQRSWKSNSKKKRQWM